MQKFDPLEDRLQDYPPDQAIPVRKVMAFILAILLLGIFLILLDGKKILAALQAADWRVIPAALFFTAVSYLCVSYTYTMLAYLWGIQMSRRDLTVICFVTSALNHVVRSGGAAGYTVRYLLMNRQGVKFNEVFSSSLMHYYLTSLDMLLMMPIALIYLILNVAIPARLTLVLVFLTMFVLLIALLATMLVFSKGLRQNLVQIAVKLGKITLRRDFTKTLRSLNNRFSQGVIILQRNTRQVIVLMGLTFVDWTASVIVLGICFSAFGINLSPGATISIYMIGIMAGVISAIPGGIGVQEGSIVAIAMLFGVGFEPAILAALLFRLIYYFVPYVCSLPCYRRLLT